MCGIITILRKDGKGAVKQVLKAYEKQKTRGTEGFGFVAVDGDGAVRVVRTESENEMRGELKDVRASVVAFHHRMPTSTPNFAEVAHPIRVSNKRLKFDYYVMHNGIITDCNKWKEKHIAEGYKYTTTIRKEYITNKQTYFSEMFNDSESLAIELAKAIDKGDATGVEVAGSIAVVVVKVEKGKGGKVAGLYYGRNEKNPLKYDTSKEYVRLASEGQGDNIIAHKLFELDLATYEVVERAFTFGDVEVVSASAYTSNSYGYNWTGYDDGDDGEENDFVFDGGGVEIEELKIELQAMQRALVKAEGAGDIASVEEITEGIEELEADLHARERRETWKAWK
jgi:predicted glutamine amidotransferase